MCPYFYTPSVHVTMSFRMARNENTNSNYRAKITLKQSQILPPSEPTPKMGNNNNGSKIALGWHALLLSSEIQKESVHVYVVDECSQSILFFLQCSNDTGFCLNNLFLPHPDSPSAFHYSVTPVRACNRCRRPHTKYTITQFNKTAIIKMRLTHTKTLMKYTLYAISLSHSIFLRKKNCCCTSQMTKNQIFL